jgi:hypothetical protein
LFCFCFVVLEFEPKALLMLGKCSVLGCYY